MSAPIPSVDGVHEDAHHLSQQRSVEGEGKSQRKGHRDHELSQGHIGQDVSQRTLGSLLLRLADHGCQNPGDAVVGHVDNGGETADLGRGKGHVDLTTAGRRKSRGAGGGVGELRRAASA